MQREGSQEGLGASVEVRFTDGVWYRGRLVERVEGTTKPQRWKVHFDDGEARDDIVLGNPESPARFDAGAYGATVEVRFDGEWCRGRLVELVSESDVWGVAFDDGDWAEDVRLGDPDVRCVFAGREPGPGEKRGRVEDVGEGAGQESRKRMDEKGAGRSGGPRDGHQKARCGRVAG